MSGDDSHLIFEHDDGHEVMIPEVGNISGPSSQPESLLWEGCPAGLQFHDTLWRCHRAPHQDDEHEVPLGNGLGFRWRAPAAVLRARWEPTP